MSDKPNPGPDEHAYLASILQDLFPPPKNRRKRSKAAPRPIPDGKGEVVAETAEQRRAIAIATLLLAQVRERDGTTLEKSVLIEVAERAMSTFPTDARAAVCEEVVAVMDWLGEHLKRAQTGSTNSRPWDDVSFDTKPYVPVIEDALQRKRDIQIEYFSVHRGQWSDRRVSPVRLSRGALTAWCHLRRDERKFHLHRIRKLELIEGEKSAD